MKILFIYLMIISYLTADNYLKSDNIVIDNKRNLMWQDNIENIQYTSNWTLSKEYCKSLTLNGYTDWKLPTIKELQQIVDIRKAKPAINSEFKFTEPSSYWSSSPDLTNKGNAWYVGFKTGATFKDSKDYNCYIRCVRSRFKK
ncbi:MAG: DUF1566 domain-containing protein [Campylobacterota bacterium]|nr:DUF1566 domain-containing protein [Campylobacterota bacterium]